MRRSFIDPATLKAVAELISDIADSAVPAGCGCREFEEPHFFGGFNPFNCDAQPFGVAGFPKEDPNKRFGIRIGNVDYPRREQFVCHSDYLRACAKFDRLIDAVEDINWDSASECTPLHRVNCIRRPAHMNPPMGVDLVGESGPCW